MVKVKHPLVKLLCKAGYSCKEAMVITQQAIDNSKTCQLGSLKCLQQAKNERALIVAFIWKNTKQGFDYWRGIHDKIASI